MLCRSNFNIRTSKKTRTSLQHLQSHPRIRVAQLVVDYLAYGWSPDEMCRQYSYLSPAEAHAAMAYYFDHQDEIDTEIRNELNEFKREHSEAQNSPIRLALRAKGLL